MAIERESLPGLEAQKEGIEAGIVASRDFMAQLGVTDVIPSLHLDPQNITQFRDRRPLVVAVNRRFLDIYIPAMQVAAEDVQLKIDNLLVESVHRVDEDLSLATIEFEESQRDAAAGYLAPIILDGLRAVIEDLRGKQTQPDYIRAKGILEAREQAEQPAIAPEIREADFSKQEIAILNQLFKERAQSPVRINGDYVVFETPIHVARAFERLLKDFSQEELSRLTEEEKLELKVRVLSRTTDLIRSGNANNLINDLPPDQQIIMRLIYLLDHNGQRGMIIQFLSENPKRFSAAIRQWIRAISSEEEVDEVSPGSKLDETNQVDIPVAESHLISEDQLLALSTYLDDPNIDYDELCEILNCEENQITDKKGVMRILVDVMRKLRTKAEEGIVSEEELHIWQKAKDFFGDEAAMETFFESLEEINPAVNPPSIINGGGPIELGPGVKQIEKRDPAVREKARGIIVEVRAKGLDRFTQWQMQELFPDNIHMKMHILPASQKGIVRLDQNPNRGNYHAVFSPLEAMVMLYYIRNLDQGYNLSAALMDDVRKIIREEIRLMDRD